MMKLTRTRNCVFYPLLVLTSILNAQPQGYNYDESRVPEYTLPAPLITQDGNKVKDAKTWEKIRRPELLKLFEEHVYGKSPERPKPMHFKVIEQTTKALNGKARRKQVSIYLGPEKKGPTMDLLLYLPAKAKGPVPVFIAPNFGGNHTIQNDKAIKLTSSWVRGRKHGAETSDNRATEAGRGASRSRWPVEMIVGRGYGLATVYYGDIDPDYHDGFKNGIHPLFYQKGQTKPRPDEWGSIGAWAWGLSRGLDYLEKDSAVDASKVIVMGHSRLGKTALWAGATDERFAIVISNNSGCGGAALSRRRFGETVKRINTSFPHWFCDNYKKYNDKEGDCPVDQHQLAALMAPRPLYIASAEGDRWADPHGEFLSAKHAAPVYELLGAGTLPTKTHPAIDKPVHGRIGYHIRSGKHNVTAFDWKAYLDFADKHLPEK